jgi:hypothetical protein
MDSFFFFIQPLWDFLVAKYTVYIKNSIEFGYIYSIIVYLTVNLKLTVLSALNNI